MKKLLSGLFAGLFLAPLLALAVNITVPSAPNAGYLLVSTSTGAYVSTGTSPLYIGSILATSSATSTFIGGIKTNLLNVSSTIASSTFANGIVLTTGCLQQNGACVTSSISDPFTHPAAGQSATTSLMLLNGNASTTMFSSYTFGYFGGGATTTIKGDSSTSTFSGGISVTKTLDVQSTIATSTFANGIELVSGCIKQNGACLSAGGTGTVTSITAGASLLGGVITTSGTLNGQVGTSSVPTVPNLAYWTSVGDTTNAAKLGSVATSTNGTASTILFLDANTHITIPYATTTAVSVSGELNAPHSGTVPTLFAGDLYVNTNSTASSSIVTSDGSNAHTLFAVHSFGITLASSTLTYYGSYVNGTAPYFVFGNGAATTSASACTTGGTAITYASNNTWTGRQVVYVAVGTASGTTTLRVANPIHSSTLRSAFCSMDVATPNQITITADVEDSN